MPARKPPAPIDTFLPDLKASHYKVRSAAVRELGKSRNPDAVEPLIAALKDKTITVRFLALRGLGKLKDPRAIEPMIPFLNHKTCRVHRAAYEELIRFGEKAVPALIGALEHSDPYIRCGAVFCLGEIGDLRALDPAQTLMKNDPDEWVRIRAARAVEEIKKKQP
ncbi:MAG TPA: HEAT repeat domain-containing protein [Aggregatilineaceae bacterium]|nr:HEAT repeat domain-containing protein [Aggregatilineaceae bacterium]